MKTKTAFPELVKVAKTAKLRVLGYDTLNDQAHARCLTALLRAYGDSPVGVCYVEPLLTNTDVAPDIVLAHPQLGVLVVEVKAYEMNYIRGIEAGNLKIRRNGQEHLVNPLRQAQRGMYAIKEAFEQKAPPDVKCLFNALVALPNINEAAWQKADYDSCIPRRLILFADDFNDLDRLKSRLAKHTHQTLTLAGLESPYPPTAEDFMMRVFGQSAILGKPSRTLRHLPFDNLGTTIDELETAQKQLSPEQNDLIHVDTWGHPYLVRGVAGSGKSIVLSYQVANNIIRHERKMMQLTLFAEDRYTMPKLAVLTLHRTLVPLLQRHIEAAYMNLTGQPLGDNRLTVTHLNGLMYLLADQHPHFHYIPVSHTVDAGERSRQYLAQLDTMTPAELDELRFDGLYIDEGQDLHTDTLTLLQTLIRPHHQTAERTISIFYDDAQNIYGHQRPVWRAFGLNVEGGRAAFMKTCYRNSREIVEMGLNVLLGTAADNKIRVQTRRFADIYTLHEKGLVDETPQGWRVKFAAESGVKPQVEVFPTRTAQIEWIAEIILSLVETEHVRREDILVATTSTASMSQLAETLTRLSEGRIEARLVGGKNRANQDEPLLIPEKLTISTVAASKGYDVPLVIMMDVDQIATNVIGRATFYVGVTRAKRYLVVTGVKTPDSLLSEAQTIAKRLFTE